MVCRTEDRQYKVEASRISLIQVCAGIHAQKGAALTHPKKFRVIPAVRQYDQVRLHKYDVSRSPAQGFKTEGPGSGKQIQNFSVFVIESGANYIEYGFSNPVARRTHHLAAGNGDQSSSELPGYDANS